MLGGIKTSEDEGKSGAKQSLIKDQIKHDLLKLSAPIYYELMGKIKIFLKNAILCDPDMWESIKNTLGTAVDQFLDDVEHEIGRNLQDAWLQRQLCQDKVMTSKYCILRPLYSFRAFVLYHYLPHDKMLFGRLKDPFFLLMYFTTFLPIHGVRIAFFSMVLLMLTLPGPPDEYQLINFILLCKGMQFLSSGICQLAKGAILYFYCYIGHRDEQHPVHLMKCIDNYGPGANDGYGLAMDYLGSIMLVWVAFGLMSRSKRHAADHRSSFESEAQESQKNLEAGGRFRALLRYDRKCFAASTIVLLLLVLPILIRRVLDNGLQAITDLRGDPLFNASMFWCCVLYSILSLPFFPFMISGLQECMTHCYATGFNQHGACVAYEGVSVEVEEPVVPLQPARLRPGSTFVMGIAAHGLKIMRSGAEYRQETSALNLKPGDLFRGVWHEYVVKPRAGSEEQQEEQTEGQVGIGKMELEDDGEDYGEPMHFGIASASIPASKMQEHYGGSAAFVVEVTAGLGLDGEAVAFTDSCAVAECMYEGTSSAPSTPGESCTWYVVRRFKEFEALAEQLGPRCKNFQNAPFPARAMLPGPVKGSQLEQRRSQLEAWLTRVMEDKRCCHEHWNKQMTDFLTANSWQQRDVARIMAQSGGLSTNLAQRLAEDPMSGPLERSRPIARHANAGPKPPENHLQQTVAVGRAARGGAADGPYKFGDYSRGLFSNLKESASAASCTKAPARLPTTTFEDDLEGQDLDSEADRLRLTLGKQPL